MNALHRATKFLLGAILPLLSLLSAHASAVSLGDELILSSLGDPVEVEIEVLQWEDMDLERVQISAATQDEYEVFDLTWLPVLDNLNFNLVGPDLNGNVRVLVSSRDPLNEPFLELLLVLRWPGGSLRREYVLLFDPPGAPARSLTQRVAPPVPEPAPVPAVVEAPVVEPPEPLPVAPAPEPEPPVQVVMTVDPPVAGQPAAIPSPAPEDPEVTDARTQVAIEVETLAPQPAQAPLDTDRRVYQVRSGDSLWNIARQFRPAGAGDNLYQVLLSIHNLNRGSFINGNISLLKANAVLQVPTVADIEGIDALSAEAEFDRRWNQGTQRFEAAQRGEAIPLFAEEPPPEEFVEIEPDLPLGVEAPFENEDEEALILVSRSDLPQPLQLTTDTQAQDALAAGSTGAETSPAPAPLAVMQAQVIMTTNVVAPIADASTLPDASEPRTVIRSVFTAELETEVAAMRARRESAEALARQLQESLEQKRAQRAAGASIFGTENLLLAGSAMALFVALIAGIVFSLRIAGDLRLRRGTFTEATLSGNERTWLAEDHGRKEPRMPDTAAAAPQAASGTNAPASAPATSGRKDTADLFARMDDMLDSEDGNLPKNS